MKKIIALVLSILMVVGLFAACGSDKKDDNKTTPETTEAPAPSTPAESTEPSESAAQFTTVKPGKLTMATNAYFAPYEFYEGDKIVGIDAEIAAAVAEKLGLELVIEDMQFDSIITAVSEGKVDMGLAGMTVNEERLKQIDFTISYASGVQVIIVKEGSSITSVDDLYADGASYKVGVQLGTTGDIYATGDFGDKVTQYMNGNEAVLALINGDVDCVIIDNEPAKAFVKANEGLVILETTYADEDYAACISKDNNALLEAINNAIMELTADGTIDAIVAKYIPAE